jgi:hypothetical protein
VTPSLRVATFSHFNKLGEDVLVETDLKTKLCRHGETSSTIRNWIQLEAHARAEGKEPPLRPSPCDCTNTHGLQNSTDTCPPPPPASVYDVLVDNEAKALDVGEMEPALQLGDRDVYLAPSGAVYCGHKMRLVPISKAVRPYAFKSRGTCGCVLTLPRRAPKVGFGRVMFG